MRPYRKDKEMPSAETAVDIGETRTRAGGQPQVRALTSVSELEEVRTVWTSWSCHPNADIDLYLLLMEHDAAILRPHVMVLYRDGKPDAMLVGRILDGAIDCKVGYKTVYKLRARLLNVIYQGLLGNGSPENCQAFATEIIKSLKRGDADAAVLRDVRVGSPLYAAARQASSFLCREYFTAPHAHRLMTVPANAGEFWLRLSPKGRNTQRRQAKRLIQDHSGSVRIRCFREPGELLGIIEDVEHVAAKTYQRALGVGFSDGIQTRQYLAQQAGNAKHRIYVLYVADTACAFWVGTVYGHTFHSTSLGYDPAYSKYSPGMFLIMRVIEELCDSQGRDGIDAIDFGVGEAQYKCVLANYGWDEATVFIFAPTLAGLRLNLMRTPVILLDRLAKTVLSRSGLLPKVKKLWRKQLRQK
jgi:CelD/BcsL family acetyltransferase involved in cellulose biosynthesis